MVAGGRVLVRACARAAGVLVVAGLAAIPAGPASAADGAQAAGPFVEPAGPTYPARSYLLFTPPDEVPSPAAGRPLLVLLHGCSQSARDIERGSHMSEAAAARGWLVAYPQQAPFTSDGTSVDGNGGACWNWFLPDHQRRGAGEPAAVAAITSRVVAQEGVDPRRVFVAGISAGADLATTMAVTYPDVFAAVGHLAGCAYADCADVTGALTVAEMGERARVVPAMLVQGTADEINNVGMGETSLHQWLSAADLLDGGADGSVSRTPAQTDSYVPPVDPTSPGDPCLSAGRYPCVGGVAGFQGSYPVTVDRFRAADGSTVVDRWLVHGLGHAWPGGDPAGSFTDPLGPDVTNALLDFFDVHPMASEPSPVVPEATPTALLVGALAVGALGLRRRALRAGPTAGSRRSRRARAAGPPAGP